MKILSKIHEMQAHSENIRLAGKRIGVVPTMGFLHEGHLSLIRLARAHSDYVITTIFVNPTQFAPSEDFASYPRDIERDVQFAGSVGADVLFVPDSNEIYPADYQTFVEVEKISGVLEGAFRPTHFRGVTTIVAKLFNITKPHVAVFGQKDAQQVAVVKQMVRDLAEDIEIIIGPIVREPDGLAMSSRNVYLSPTERAEAVVLSQSLSVVRQMIDLGERNSNFIKVRMKELIASKRSTKIDYVSIADPRTLDELVYLSPAQTVLVSLAVHVGKTRLIDNELITVQ